MGKYQIGQKVVPHKKSVWGKSVSDSTEWNRAKEKGQPYLYVNSYEEDTGYLVLHSERIGGRSGDFFLDSDVTLYQKGFTRGDRVKRKNGLEFSNGSMVATVDKTTGWNSQNVWLKETRTWVEADAIELVTAPKVTYKVGDTVLIHWEHSSASKRIIAQDYNGKFHYVDYKDPRHQTSSAFDTLEKLIGNYGSHVELVRSSTELSPEDKLKVEKEKLAKENAELRTTISRLEKKLSRLEGLVEQLDDIVDDMEDEF